MQKAQVVWTTWARINGGEGGRFRLSRKPLIHKEPW